MQHFARIDVILFSLLAPNDEEGARLFRAIRLASFSRVADREYFSVEELEGRLPPF